MVRIKDDVFVYAEGGGSGAGSAGLQSEYRRVFSEFFRKTILGDARRPRLVVCGGRYQAFDAFQTAIRQGTNALLLVDSETAVDPAHEPPPASNWQPWVHLHRRDGWAKPPKATDDDCHLMVQCMESWFLADWETVKRFFGRGFEDSELPAGGIETIPKTTVYETLKKATRGCTPKGVYGKGAHSFKLLALIDPSKVTAASPWAERFIEELAKRKRKP